MASLKQDPHETSEYYPNNFGYGTEIHLTGEQCEKLGIMNSVKAGQPVTIRASGVVSRSEEVLEGDTDSGGKDISICVQLTDMSVSMSGTANAAKAAKMLYGSDED
jgi:hypothetical protein